VLAARTAFELSLEKQAMENAIAPPADLRNKIADKIAGGGQVIPIRSGTSGKKSWFKYAAAASVILLAGSLFYNITLYKKNKSLQATMKKQWPAE